jgi:hypothetical protein
MKTVAGEFFESFLKWKSIPATEGKGDYAKASKFDVSNYRDCLESLKQLYD